MNSAVVPVVSAIAESLKAILPDIIDKAASERKVKLAERLIDVLEKAVVDGAEIKNDLIKEINDRDEAINKRDARIAELEDKLKEKGGAL